MSLWHCPEHGLTGPMACCQSATLARIELSNQGMGTLGMQGVLGTPGALCLKAGPAEAVLIASDQRQGAPDSQSDGEVNGN